VTGADVLAALAIPGSAHVGRRVPKTLLAERGAPTAADRRAIASDIESMMWVAALKPATIGVPAFRDDSRSYEEIEVMHLTVRDGAKRERLTALVHRAIPYPVLLVADTDSHTALSVAHIRWSQAETDKTVLAGDVIAALWDRQAATPVPDAFRDALALAALPATSLLAVYEGWVHAIVSFQVWCVTKTFVLPSSPGQAEAKRRALARLADLDMEVARLRAQAERTTQVVRKAEINVALKRLREARAAAEANL
jgi:hypothetical protein